MSEPSAIRFVTGNEGKVREAGRRLPVSVEAVAFDYVEIQSDDLVRIATAGARETAAALGGTTPIIVEDSGLFVDGLGGFPGPYSAYVEGTLGVEAVWRLAERECEEPRRARFRSVIALVDPGSTRGSDEKGFLGVETFEGTVSGRIVAPRGSGGFGYDPIFEYDGVTLAEMSVERKNAISHRGRALDELAARLAERDGTAEGS